MEAERFLERGKELFSVSLEGDHDHRCYFESFEEALGAALDSIFVRDLVGYADIDHPANGRYTTGFRFEDSLRLTRYVIMGDSVAYTKSFGNIQIPVIEGATDIGITPPESFNTFISYIIDEIVIRETGSISMVKINGPIIDVWVSWSLRINTEIVLAHYYQTLIDDMSSPALTGYLVSDAAKPSINSPSFEVGDSHIIRVAKGLAEGKTANELFRLAAFSAESQRYVLSEDFYMKLWSRDLPQFYFDEAAFPDFYSPKMSFSWNYNRLLDVKTLGYWLKVHQSKYNYPTPTKMDMRLLRFSLAELRNFKVIYSTDSCFGNRMMFSIDDRLQRFIITAPSGEFLEYYVMKFVPEEGLWYRRGTQQGTAIPDPSIIQFDLQDEGLSEFFDAVLGYLIRSNVLSRIRFG